MPNEKKHALRYLLLRYLWQAQNLVSSDIYREIVKTLSVDKLPEGFRVQWIRSGHLYSRDYGANDFKFYVRGDRTEDKHAELDHSTNDRLARLFVKDALGIKELEIKRTSENFFPNMRMDLLLYLLLCGTFVLAGGAAFIRLSMILFVLFTVEFIYPLGKLIIPFLAVILVESGFLFSSMLITLLYLTLQSLDPNRNLRSLKLIFGILAFDYAVFQMIQDRIYPVSNSWLVIYFFIPVLVFLARWTLGSHFRSFPLIFPFFCFGLYLDGYERLAAIGLICAAAEILVAYGRFRFFPIQKQNSLPPNG